jgi:hypothetical protein
MILGTEVDRLVMRPAHSRELVKGMEGSMEERDVHLPNRLYDMVASAHVELD